jgi:hypothetical protein
VLAALAFRADRSIDRCVDRGEAIRGQRIRYDQVAVVIE